MALSTYLPLSDRFEPEVASNPRAQSKALPIFMAHGSYDPVLPLALGTHARDLLAATGYEVEWHDYPMAHAVCAEEIADIRRWLVGAYA